MERVAAAGTKAEKPMFTVTGAPRILEDPEGVAGGDITRAPRVLEDPEGVSEEERRGGIEGETRSPRKGRLI